MFHYFQILCNGVEFRSITDDLYMFFLKEIFIQKKKNEVNPFNKMWDKGNRTKETTNTR